MKEKGFQELQAQDAQPLIPPVLPMGIATGGKGDMSPLVQNSGWYVPSEIVIF